LQSGAARIELPDWIEAVFAQIFYRLAVGRVIVGFFISAFFSRSSQPVSSSFASSPRATVQTCSIASVCRP
jgi:predicted MFS family arabinose efflux permease